MNTTTDTKGACQFPGCERHVIARGLCWAHYQQQRRGKTLVPVRPYIRRTR